MHDIHVNIGEIGIGKPHHTLRATLGSCVGIAIWWGREKKSALAHCLLCNAPESYAARDARYASRAVVEIIRKLHVPKERIRELVAEIAGGNQMLGISVPVGGRHQGERNREAALLACKEQGVYVLKVHPPSHRGSQIFLDCDSGAVTARTIPGKESTRSNSSSIAIEGRTR